jgi:hypothetical protein
MARHLKGKRSKLTMIEDDSLIHSTKGKVVFADLVLEACSFLPTPIIILKKIDADGLGRVIFYPPQTYS